LLQILPEINRSIKIINQQTVEFEEFYGRILDCKNSAFFIFIPFSQRRKNIFIGFS